MSALTRSPEWKALLRHAASLRKQSIVGLFKRDPQRAQDFAAEAAGIELHYAKQLATRDTVKRLLALAGARGLPAAIESLFAGEQVNVTEHRPALHMALRAPRGERMSVAGADVVPAVHAVLDRMGTFADRVRSGSWQGHSGQAITDVVNIGIGGSDLGPRMVCRALAHVADGPRMHFVSNVDGSDLAAILKAVKPATTLWIVTSKTFTTQETMANAHSARRWFLKAAGEKDIPRHFVAVSTNKAEVEKFGIASQNMFEFWDWVGGRYSLWSAVGLSIVLAVGPKRFRDLLAGAHAMDQHFRAAPLASNLPVLMGLLGIWNTNFLGAGSHVLAPYDQRLEKFPAWAQQLEMESNGKRVDRGGKAVDYATMPVLWGDVGTNAQHAYFQMLHQGPTTHPVDFILTLAPDHDLVEQHRMLMANGLAQSAALMRGKTAAEVRAELAKKGLSGAALAAAIPHRVFPGNRPSNTLLLKRLDPIHLGALLALYEHRTYVQSVIWNINAFDQWGVELGKQLAGKVLDAIAGKGDGDLDPSTARLVGKL